MYNSNNDEYLEATKEARINQDTEVEVSKSKHSIMIPLILVSTVVVGYVGYTYMDKSDSINTELIVTMEPEKEYEPISIQVDEGDKVGTVVSSQKEESESKDYFVITIKKGDTLASLSKKYFGNEMFFNRILALNKGLKEKSVLKIGQKINIPN